MGLDTGPAQHLYSAHIKAGLLNEYAQSVGEQVSPSDSQPLAIFTARVTIQECICLFLFKLPEFSKKKGWIFDPKYTYMYTLNDQIYFGYRPLIYIKKRSRPQNEIEKLAALTYIVDVRLSQGDYVESVNDQTLINLGLLLLFLNFT